MYAAKVRNQDAIPCLPSAFNLALYPPAMVCLPQRKREFFSKQKLDPDICFLKSIAL